MLNSREPLVRRVPVDPGGADYASAFAVPATRLPAAAALTEQTEQTEWTERTERAGRAGRAGRTGRAKRGEGTGQVPEGWARAAWEGAPGGVRWFLRTAWSTVLGLRLGPRNSAVHVLGWPVAESGPAAVTLEARSRLLTARNVVSVDGSGLVWVTFVRFENTAGRMVWAAATPVHCLTIPLLLRRTLRRTARGPARRAS